MDWIKVIFQGIDIFFIIYLLGYSTFLILSIIVGATVLYEQHTKKKLYNFIDQDPNIPVSIIVPAYNEHLTVVDTVESLLQLDYSAYEIIVVDDGSTDGMSERLVEHFNMERLYRSIDKKVICEDEQALYIACDSQVPITLICKNNGGKADALNMGINASKYPYFICMDADSVLQSDALKNIVIPLLEEENVIACGGLIRLLNNVVLEKGQVKGYGIPNKLLVGMQMIEYDRSFLASRLLFDKFNGNLIISGAFGLFKKDVVMAIGGYNRDTVGEDMELVVRLHAFCRANKISYKMKYVTDAICWSQAPESIRDLMKQRRRWHRGLFQSILAHRKILFNVDYGAISFVSFLYFTIYELCSPYIELFGLFSIVIAILLRIVNIPYMIIFLLIYMVFGILMSLTAFFSSIYTMDISLRLRDVIKATMLCILESCVLRGVLFWTRLMAFANYKKQKLHWDSITRHEINRSEVM